MMPKSPISGLARRRLSNIPNRATRIWHRALSTFPRRANKAALATWAQYRNSRRLANEFESKTHDRWNGDHARRFIGRASAGAGEKSRREESRTGKNQDRESYRRHPLTRYRKEIHDRSNQRRKTDHPRF